MSGHFAGTGVGFKPAVALDYRDKISAIRDCLGGPRVELVGRFLLPGLGVSLVAVLTFDKVLVLV